VGRGAARLKAKPGGMLRGLAEGEKQKTREDRRGFPKKEKGRSRENIDSIMGKGEREKG